MGNGQENHRAPITSSFLCLVHRLYQCVTSSLNLNLGDRAFRFRSSHDLDLLQFGSLKTKERRHLYDLIFAYEVFWVGTELLDSWFEVAAAHRLGYVEAHTAFAA